MYKTQKDQSKPQQTLLNYLLNGTSYVPFEGYKNLN